MPLAPDVSMIIDTYMARHKFAARKQCIRKMSVIVVVIIASFKNKNCLYQTTADTRGHNKQSGHTEGWLFNSASATLD